MGRASFLLVCSAPVRLWQVPLTKESTDLQRVGKEELRGRTGTAHMHSLNGIHPRLFTGAEFDVMTMLLGIKFLVSEIRNREGCHPLEMK